MQSLNFLTCRVFCSRYPPIALSLSPYFTFFFMAISHFIVQLTVTFTHTWSVWAWTTWPAYRVVCRLNALFVVSLYDRPSTSHLPPP